MTESAKKLPNYIENPPSDRDRKLTVPGDSAGLRLDQALTRLLPEYSRNRLQDWIRGGHVTVDGAPASAKSKVWGGETILVTPQAAPGDAVHAAEDIPLDIVFEDDHILVIDKPAGLVVHPGSGNWSGTMLNALLRHAALLADIPRAGIVHRLDKDTSGLLVVAKTLQAQTALVRQLQARTVSREYVAVVHGVLDADGMVEAPIGRHPVSRTRMAVVAKGKPAVTHYAVRASGDGWSLLDCRLETGRTHQIRVHLHSLGHPLIGDPVYTTGRKHISLPQDALDFPRQALHAARLALVHPQSARPMSWKSPLPGDIAALIEALENA
ncbi:MAG TPA: 23S rRNA pseudouridine(1911/1915/1917) synthase RluD [Burkholderiales bacterium]